MPRGSARAATGGGGPARRSVSIRRWPSNQALQPTPYSLRFRSGFQARLSASVRLHYFTLVDWLLGVRVSG